MTSVFKIRTMLKNISSTKFSLFRKYLSGFQNIFAFTDLKKLKLLRFYRVWKMS